jgi:hypothetical protein
MSCKKLGAVEQCIMKIPDTAEWMRMCNVVYIRILIWLKIDLLVSFKGTRNVPKQYLLGIPIVIAAARFMLIFDWIILVALWD